AILFGRDHVGRSKRARAGIRQFSFSVRGSSRMGSARREFHTSQAADTRTTTDMATPSTITSTVTLTLGKTVEMTSTSESSKSALTMIVATTFNHGLLTQGPSTARSLYRRTRKTVALGSSVPASAWTAVVMRPSGACGIRPIAAATASIATYEPKKSLASREP